jgi:hypothetical protein
MCFATYFFGKYVAKRENVEKLSYLRYDCIIVWIFYHHGEPECLSPDIDRL